MANHTAKDRETSSSRIDVELQALIEDVLGDESDHYGVVVKDTRTNTTASVNPDAIFYAASLFKLPIMVEAFRQRELGLISFDDEIFATWDDVLEDLGTFPGDVGDVYTVADLLELMITISDNTSAIMLLRTLGPGTIDETMSSLGLTTTSVLTEELPTTAVDMATLLEAIERGQAVGAGASREMVDLMLRQTWRSRIPQGVPEGVLVGNKTGDWWDAAHDVAIVYAPGGAYVIAILSDGEGSDATIVELSERVYDYFQACRGRNAPVRI
ncbi:MAG TPA: serine hydrolase [Chloroflexota bacterium]|nr:serine hydrolase [Chloroflexota bacterium]